MKHSEIYVNTPSTIEDATADALGALAHHTLFRTAFEVMTGAFPSEHRRKRMTDCPSPLFGDEFRSFPTVRHEESGRTSTARAFSPSTLFGQSKRVDSVAVAFSVEYRKERTIL